MDQGSKFDLTSLAPHLQFEDSWQRFTANHFILKIIRRKRHIRPIKQSTPCQLLQPQHHLRTGFGQWRNGGEVIGIANRAEPGRHAAPAPSLNNGPALPEVLRTFVATHYSVETSLRRRRPEQGTCGTCSPLVEAQCL